MLKNFSKLRLDMLAKKQNFLFTFNNLFKYNFTQTLTREQKEEINNLLNSNQKYSQKLFDEYVKILPITEIGSQNLDKRIFEKALKDASSPQDIEAILVLVAEFMGHYNPITGNQLDELVKKSIQLDAVDKLTPLFKNHRAILYYPHPNLIEEIVENYYSKNDFVKLKQVFSSMLRREYIKKSSNVYNKVIDIAYKNKDYEFMFEIFVDILDPTETILENRFYNAILITNPKFAKDRPLKDHIESTLETLKFTNIGSLIAFAVFELINKNMENYESYVKRINASLDQITTSTNNNPEILESEEFKKILEQIITEKTDDKILNILKNDIVKQQIFDSSYNEVLSKLQ